MKGHHRATPKTDLNTALHALMSDTPLAEKYRDHPLSGEWSDFRDCQVRPEIVLICERLGAETLRA